MASGESRDDIERQMALLRAAMRQEARDVAESARTLADWRYHFRGHPFLFCAAAAALGYLIVPGRTRVGPRTSGQGAVRAPLNGAVGASSGSDVPAAGRPLVTAALGLAANFAAKQAASFVARRGQEALRRYARSRSKHDSPAEVLEGDSVD
jgi:hypothetical protein